MTRLENCERCGMKRRGRRWKQCSIFQGNIQDIHMKAKSKKELLNIPSTPTVLAPNTFQMIVKGITTTIQNYS